MGSCLLCFNGSNDIEHDSLRTSSLRSRPPQRLESLLADHQDRDTEAETVSLHSNLSSGNSRRKEKKKRSRDGNRITLFDLNMFGRPTGPIRLPKDEEGFDRFLNRPSNRRERQTSSSSSTTPTGGARSLRHLWTPLSSISSHLRGWRNVHEKLRYKQRRRGGQRRKGGGFEARRKR